MNQQDPLSKLVASGTKEADRQRLADLLEPYVVLDEKSYQANFKDKFFELQNNTDRLEIILLAEKARALFFEKGEGEGLSPTSLINLEFMPKGSVKTTLKNLFDKKKILKNSEGKYYIPNYRVNELFLKFTGSKK